MKTVKIEFMGKKLEFTTEPEVSACRGCAAENSNKLCSVLTEKFNCSEVIFKNVNEKATYTLDEIKQAYKYFGGYEMNEGFVSSLEKIKDPDFNEYQRLKAKFEV